MKKIPKKQNNSNPDLYNEIVENLPDLICHWIPDGTLIFANKTYCDYFGKSKQQVAGASFLEYIHPNDQGELKKHIKEIVRLKSSARIELRVIKPDGDIRWHQWIDTVFYNNTTKQNELLSTGRDITDLKNAEFELQRRMDLERLITNLSINFINLPPDDIDDHINQMLSKIGRFLNVERSYVFLLNDKDESLTNTHEWCAEGVDPKIRDMQNLSYQTNRWVLSRLKELNVIHIPNVNELPPEASDEKKLFQNQNIQSLIIIPLINAGKLLGFIGFDSVINQKFWTEDEITVLRIVGGIVGNAIIHKRNTKELSYRKSYLEKLNQITFESLNSKNSEEMLDSVAKKIGAVINSDISVITQWDEKWKNTTYTAYHGEIKKEFNIRQFKPDDLLETGTFIETVQTLIIEDVANYPTINKNVAELLSLRSLLSVPMVADGKKLGSALFGFTKIHTFTEEEVALAQQATSQIAQALLKIHLLEQAKKSAKEAETLHKAGTIVASTLDPHIAIQSILDQLESVVPFDRASVQIFGDNYVEVKATKGWPPNNDPVGERIPVPGNNPNSAVIQTYQPYVVNDAQDIFPTNTELDNPKIRSWLGVPLLVREEVIGLLTLHHHQPNYYDDVRLINLVTAFADQVAIALENSRLYAEERQRVKELEVLQATTADITQELALESLLSAILERATFLLNATGGELGLMDESGENIEILVCHNMGINTVGTSIRVGEGFMGYVAKSKQIEMIENYGEWEGRLESYKDSKVHAAIAAPLIFGKRLLGVIGIMNSDSKRIFTPSEKSIMNFFAQQSAIAVENAKLYEQQKREARIDLLTNIYNRRGLFELAQREFARSLRYDRPLAAIMLDIDNFKTVNDTHGHAIGDLVLKELAERLTNNLRTIDLCCRYGGEEFIILLPETSVEGATEVAERLRRTVANKPFTPNMLSLSITISLGVSVLKESVKDLDTLLNQVDFAMYRSKYSGRNCVTLYEDSFPKMGEN